MYYVSKLKQKAKETWNFLRDPANQGALRILGGIILAIAGGVAWMFTHIYESGKKEVYEAEVKQKAKQPPMAKAFSEKESTGRIVFSSNRNGNYHIFAMDSDGANIEQLTLGDWNDYSPDCSPDGREIAFERIPNPRSFITFGPQPDIYIINRDGTNERRITQLFDSSNPSWSPDGRRIAFERGFLGFHDIYVMSAFGTQITQLTNRNANTVAPTWSPDGKHIAFSDVWNIYVIEADGANERSLTWSTPFVRWTNESPSWSPDGSKIIFVSNRDGNLEIYIMNSDGTDQKNLTSNPADDSAPQWSSNERYIMFSSNRDGNFEIYIMSVDGSNLINLSRDPAEDRWPSWCR